MRDIMDLHVRDTGGILSVPVSLPVSVAHTLTHMHELLYRLTVFSAYMLMYYTRYQIPDGMYMYVW